MQLLRRMHVQVLHDSYVKGQPNFGALDVVPLLLADHVVLGARLP